MAMTLRAGDRGELVKRLQTALISFGYDLGPAAADGTFGDGTKLAVESFQSARDLPATGVADPETISAMDLDPDTLDDLIEIEGQADTTEASSPVAVVDEDNVYLDPPVRLWPQYDNRWKDERIAGPKTGRLLDWISNGCNACVAAMTLRWFAEDCPAGKVSFPTKPDGTIDPSWYGLRMGECFWPNADPPGKVELTPEGRIHFRKLYSVCAHYLKTGEIQRNDKGNVVDPSGPKAYYVTRRPDGGWLDLIRKMLATGPVIVGIGAPAGHFVVAHGVIGGALLIADPGGVLYTAHIGGGPKIANWKGKDGYLDGTMDRESVRMPSPSQWPEGRAPGLEGDGRSYNLISGQYLTELMANLISVTSLTYPEGAKLGSGA
jgi:hypothetical protein